MSDPVYRKCFYRYGLKDRCQGYPILLGPNPETRVFDLSFPDIESIYTGITGGPIPTEFCDVLPTTSWTLTFDSEQDGLLIYSGTSTDFDEAFYPNGVIMRISLGQCGVASIQTFASGTGFLLNLRRDSAQNLWKTTLNVPPCLPRPDFVVPLELSIT